MRHCFIIINSSFLFKLIKGAIFLKNGLKSGIFRSKSGILGDFAGDPEPNTLKQANIKHPRG